MSKDKQREAERAARRAKRLAERADQRARRKGEQAREAEERAARLAERARQRTGSYGSERSSGRSPRERELESSFEDFVDDMAHKWSRKAEEWVDDQSRKLFGESDHKGTEYDADYYSDDDDDWDYGSERDSRRAARDARAARQEAEAARKAAEEAAAHAKANARSRSRKESRSSSRSRDRSKAPNYDRDLKSKGRMSRRRRARRDRVWGKRRHRTLYRDSEAAKVCGVCAGVADYLNVPNWVVRLVTVIAAFNAGPVVVPAYFIMYFLLDDKPLYRKVTDRFDEVELEETHMSKSKKSTAGFKRAKPEDTAKTMRLAKQKFADIEMRLRQMESHVTSSQFELQREFKKMVGDEPKGAV